MYCGCVVCDYLCMSVNCVVFFGLVVVGSVEKSFEARRVEVDGLFCFDVYFILGLCMMEEEFEVYVVVCEGMCENYSCGGFVARVVEVFDARDDFVNFF